MDFSLDEVETLLKKANDEPVTWLTPVTLAK
jgi:hypothetical protein